jgi:hypothetical protein
VNSVSDPGGRSAGAGRRDGGDGLAVVVSLWDPVEADMVACKLRSAGIDVYVRHEASSVVFGLTVDGLGRQDVMVRAEDLDEALLILGEDPDAAGGSEAAELDSAEGGCTPEDEEGPAGPGPEVD